MFKHHSDPKLLRIAESPLGRGQSLRTLRELERLADIGHVAAGTVIQEEGRAMPWSYCILDGMALVESSGSHLAAVPAGAWLLGSPPGEGLRASVVAASDVEMLCFRRGEFAQALGVLPELAGCIATT